MTDIVIDWLNTNVELSEIIYNIPKQFANGYLFGELLWKLKWISTQEFNQFRNKNSSNIHYKHNFKLLTTMLKNYSIEWQKKMITGILNEDCAYSGVLIYKIKTAVDNRKINLRKIRGGQYNFKEKDFSGIPSQFLTWLDGGSSNDKEMDNYKNSDAQENSKQFVPNNRYGEDQEKRKLKNKVHYYSKKIKWDVIPQDEVDKNENGNEDNDKNEVDKEQERDEKKNKTKNKEKPKESDEDSEESFSKIRSHTESCVNPQTINDKDKNNDSMKLKNKKPLLVKTDYINDRIKDSLTERKAQYNAGNIIFPYDFEINAFTKSLNSIGVEVTAKEMQSLNGKLNLDMNQDVIMEKLREKLKITWKEKKKRQEQMSEAIREDWNKINVLSKSAIIVPTPLKPIDFLKRDLNPWIPKHIPNQWYVSNSKSKSFQWRLNYEQKMKLTNEQTNLSKRLSNFRSLVLKSSDNHCLFPIKNEEDAFDITVFFSNLNRKNLSDALTESNHRLSLIREDTPIIMKITYQIIDMAFEGYLYQTENKKELIEWDKYKEMNKLFINNLPFREVAEDEETKKLKKQISFSENDQDINSIVFTQNEEHGLFNYVNYWSEWDYDTLVPPEETGKKVDYHVVLDNNADEEFEPTLEEIEDLTVPGTYNKNYMFGRFIMEVIKAKFKLENDSSTKAIEKGSVINKWEHIPMKVCLVGYPLSGKKTQGKLINERYKGIKIYNIHSIWYEYVDKWKEINEPIEKHPKYKTLKAPQIEALEKEKNEKLQKFEEIRILIQPYLDLLDNSNKQSINTISGEHQKDEQVNSNTNLSIQPPNEVLLKILITEIERDFPVIPQDQLNNLVLKHQAEMIDLVEKLNHLREENWTSKKPRIKEEQAWEKEIEKWEINSYSGFIITDFPANISQCLELEHYLTGYVNELSLPKSNENIVLSKLSNVLDIQYNPKERSTITKAGIDFWINMNASTDTINSRFVKLKYDPVSKQTYNEEDILSGALKIDKKVQERWVDEIPNFNKQTFDFWIDEYNANYEKMEKWYNKFGVWVDKKLIPSNHTKQEDSAVEKNGIIPSEIVPSDSNSQCNTQLIKVFQQIDNSKSTPYEITEYIITDLLQWLYRIAPENEKYIYYKLNIKEKDNVPDVQTANNTNNNNNTINSFLSLRESKKTKMTMISKFVLIHSSDVINEIYGHLMDYNDEYCKQIKFFIYLTSKQKKEIIERMNLTKNKFCKFISRDNEKKSLIGLFISKYKSFVTEYPQLITHDKIKQEFNSDLIELNDKLWSFVEDKKITATQELHSYRSCHYIENEIKKFYFNVVNVFQAETNKLINLLDITAKYYLADLSETVTDKIKSSFLWNGLTDILLSRSATKNERSSPSEQCQDKTIFIHNINTMYQNMFKFLFKLNPIVNEIISKLKLKINKVSIIDKVKKHIFTKKKTSDSPSIMDVHNTTINSNKSIPSWANKDNTQSTWIEDWTQIISNEKRKYKFKLTMLKYYSINYINKINYWSDKVFECWDNWIVLSVREQNNQINSLIEKFRKYIDSGDYNGMEGWCNEIEWDNFENMDLYDEINIEDELNFSDKHGVQSMYWEKHNKLFGYNVGELKEVYTEIKKYAVEYSIVNYDIFMEMFVKKYLANNYGDVNKTEIVSNILKHLTCEEYRKFYEYYHIKTESILNEGEESEKYINIDEVFTIISLIGSLVISSDKVDKIILEWQSVLIKGNWLSKNEFMKYHFWFENDTYFVTMHEKNPVSGEKITSDNPIKIKELLFDIWKSTDDEMNFLGFMNVINPSRYANPNYLGTDYESNRIKYFNLLFD